MSTNATAPASYQSVRSTRPRAATVALWALQIALAAALGMAGVSKLAGAPAMIQLFDAVGVGQWLRYVTGALEMLGAVALLVPRVASLGALLLIGVMSGAVLSHLVALHTSPAAPLGLLAGLAVVAFVRRREIAAWVARLRG